VVLEGDQRQCQTGVCAEPELKRDIQGGLGEGVTGSANLAGSHGVTRSVNIGERGIGDESKLGGVTNHLEVSALLLGSHGELVPDVHPVTILAIDALASNLDLNLGDQLLSGEIQPTSIDGVVSGGNTGGVTHELVDLGKSDLKIGAVSKITVSADNAGNTATEIGLAVESLFNRLNSKVCVTTVCYFPKSNLRIARKVNVLCAISYKLH